MKFNKCLTSFQALMTLAIFTHGRICTTTTTIGHQFCKWVDLPGRVSDELIDRDIRRSIAEQLVRKGLTKVGGDRTFMSANKR